MNDFWKDRRVLVTGHTGFKGSWLCLWLTQLGARVTGLSLEPETSFFASLGLEGQIEHRICDMRDLDAVMSVVQQSDPHVVLHLAAQAIVLKGYTEPATTWSTNVTGSLNLMQALGALQGPCSAVMVTTDKVYQNDETTKPFLESDPLGGQDPYSASKAAMEIAVNSWSKSFFDARDIRMATARAGNVIGGGDWAENRLLPDVMRALARDQVVDVRNPKAVRPWQHVLDPLRGYLTLGQRLFESDNPRWQTPFNFGPDPQGVRTVEDVLEAALRVWPGSWRNAFDASAPHEATTLMLDTTKATTVLGHQPRWGFEQSIEEAVRWYKEVHEGVSAKEVCLAQLQRYGAP